MSTSDHTTPSRLLRIETVCNQFETDKQNGSEQAINAYVPNTNSETGFEIARQLLIIEWDHRLQQGEQFQLKDVLNHELLPKETLKHWFESWRNTRSSPGRIAHFRLIEKLGSGSFGTVWRAFDERLNRDVALKVAHASLSNDSDRFLREAKSAAQLRHPAIVKILDAGQWEGRFCIVQEYVAGESLSELLKTKTFSFAESVELCLTLAQALSCSHAQGCVHRDIKPQNILIQDNGQPVLIDFGLAKNTSAESTQTRSGTILGTPVFMSPEQARGTSHLADARSDIYSMGILLFNLLTSEVPFRGNFEMILLQVLNQDPPNPRKLNRDIPVDLATICLKCIEKEPRRRYATAADLADDLSRFLEGRPVKARPVGHIYQSFRWVRRNKVLAALIASLVLLTISITSNAIISERSARNAWKTEQRLREEAVAARQQADLLAEQARVEAKLAKQVTGYLEEAYSWGDLLGTQLYDASNIASSDIKATQMLERAVERMEVELAEQPRVQLRLLAIISNVYRSMGEFAKARLLLDRAEKIWIGLVKQSPELDLSHERALHLFCEGCLMQSLGLYDSALERLNESLQAHLNYLDANDLEISDVYFQMGWLYLEWHRPEQGEVYFDKALKIRKMHLANDHRLVWTTQLAKALCKTGPNPDLMTLAINAVDQEFAPEIVELAIKGVGIQIAKSQKDYVECERLYRQVLEIMAEKFGADHPVRVLASGDFASILYKRGKYAEAYEIIESAIAIGKQLAPNHPQLSEAYRKIGFEMSQAGRYVEAEQYLNNARRMQSFDTNTEFSTSMTLAQTLIKLQKFDQAREVVESVSKPRKLSENEALYLMTQAEICLGLGEFEKAYQLDQQTLEVVDVIVMSYQSAFWLRRFAGIYERAGRIEQAEDLLRQAVAQSQKNRPADHPRISDSMFDLGRLLVSQSRTDEAVPHLNEALRIRLLQLPSDDLRIIEARELIDVANSNDQ